MPPSPTTDAIKTLYPKDDFKGRNLGSPFIAQLYLFCCSEHFRTQRQPYKTIWDVPYAMAGYFYLTHLEMNGQLRIENEQEKEINEEFHRLESEALAERSEREKNGQPEPSGEPAIPSGLATPPPNFGEPSLNQ